MKKYFDLKNKEIRASILCAGIGIIALIAYTIYGNVFDYFDTAVFGAILIGILLAGADAAFAGKPVRILNLFAVMSLSFAVAIFFMNSFPVWADNLTGITMYNSRGGLPPMICVLVMQLAAIVMGIISCFTGKGEKK